MVLLRCEPSPRVLDKHVLSKHDLNNGEQAGNSIVGYRNAIARMSTQSDIRVSPRSASWFAGTFVFGIIAANVPLMTLAYFYLPSSAGRIPALGIVAALGFGAMAGGWFTWWLQERLHWRLTELELLGGRRGNTRLPLSSLERIIIGLPNKFAIPGMEKLVPPQIRATSILLCFADGSLLPMHLHGLPNGSRLMGELLTRFPERIDQNYRYSAKEISILRKADVNMLIKRNLAAGA